MDNSFIKRQDVIDAFYVQSDDDGWWCGTAQDAEVLLNGLPSAEPEQKTGKWIDIDSETYTWMIRCSECGHERSMMSTQGIRPNYCENCGSYNGGEK